MSSEVLINTNPGNDGTVQTVAETKAAWSNAMSAFKSAASPLNDDQIMALLANVVEGEIVPRLMMVHRNDATPNNTATPHRELSDEEIVKFALLTLSGDVDDLENYVVELTREGFAIEALFLDLLAPAARKLGVYWEQDKCSFTDVTIGLGRLQTLLYRMSARQNGVLDDFAFMPRGLFITPVGGQHSFGIRMVADLFKRAGWMTLCEPSLSIDQATCLVQTQTFDLVGIGISSQEQVEPARKLIKAVRLASANPSVQLMVGGSLIIAQPELARQIGADLSACDAREAVTIAQNIVYGQKTHH